MKTTLELPDLTFRQAKMTAASQGVTLKQFFTEALEEKLLSCAKRKSAAADEESSPAWMAGFGQLSDLADENARILQTIEAEFETIEPEDLA
ncbi:MAG: hypothetical protein ACI8UO_005814 [Verrucomicrobiales bacterium]|jgi:hypothetical protein